MASAGDACFRCPRVVLFVLLGLPLPGLAEPTFEYQRPDVEALVGADEETQRPATFERFAVAAPHPLAADAAFQVLAAGGSAIDAAIAAQMVLGVVAPHASGIGGGALLLHYDGESVQAYDGRETAPAQTDASLFLDGEQQPLAFEDALASGRAVGVPGMLRMLEMAHDDHGALPWASLLAPAITLAEEGVPVGARLHGELAARPELAEQPTAGAFYFTEQGEPLPAEHRLRNPALAAILRGVAEEGSSALHVGPVAEELVARVQGHPAMPGALSLEDMATYTAEKREPLCTPWQRWRICGFPPPSGGHLTVMQILGTLSRLSPLETPLEKDRPSVDWLDRFLAATQLAFAGPSRYIGDPDFVEAPGDDWSAMLQADALEERAALIEKRDGKAGESSATEEGEVRRAGIEQNSGHVSIIDAEGRAVALTASLGSPFGARLLVDDGMGAPGGYWLNGQLARFDFQSADDQGTPLANRVEAEKRPRASMSPTLVFRRDANALVASLGAPEGLAGIPYVASALVALLDWDLDPRRALALPHALALGDTAYLEAGRFPAAVRSALAERGHAIEERDLPSDLQVVRRTPDGHAGAADPRGDGAVRGE